MVFHFIVFYCFLLYVFVYCFIVFYFIRWVFRRSWLFHFTRCCLYFEFGGGFSQSSRRISRCCLVLVFSNSKMWCSCGSKRLTVSWRLYHWFGGCVKSGICLRRCWRECGLNGRLHRLSKVRHFSSRELLYVLAGGYPNISQRVLRLYRTGKSWEKSVSRLLCSYIYLKAKSYVLETPICFSGLSNNNISNRTFGSTRSCVSEPNSRRFIKKNFEKKNASKYSIVFVLVCWGRSMVDNLIPGSQFAMLWPIRAFVHLTVERMKPQQCWRHVPRELCTWSPSRGGHPRPRGIDM